MNKKIPILIITFYAITTHAMQKNDEPSFNNHPTKIKHKSQGLGHYQEILLRGEKVLQCLQCKKLFRYGKLHICKAKKRQWFKTITINDPLEIRKKALNQNTIHKKKKPLLFIVPIFPNYY